MKILRLRNRLLLSAFVISVLTALAYMAAVSWVIRLQYLDQAEARLQKAASVIADTLAERQRGMLTASRQLAAQKNLGSTIWYLAQYAQSPLDHETLLNTYQRLARTTYETGHIANASHIAIYNADGQLVSFAVFDARGARFGYVEGARRQDLQVAQLKPGATQSDPVPQAADASVGVRMRLDGPLLTRESAHYAVVDGRVSIETYEPVLDQVFDPVSGKLQLRQQGVVMMTQALDQAFVRQLARLTDTRINVFSPQGFSSGSFPAYRKPDWSGLPDGPGYAGAVLPLNEITIDRQGYYQRLLPLRAGTRAVAYIATLHSKADVQKNTMEMIGILGLIALGSLVLIIPFAWYFATSIAQPLSGLGRIFRSVARGEQSDPLNEELHRLNCETASYGEMEELKQCFMAMRDAVRQKIAEINRINASLEQIVAERTAALATKEQESRTLIENSLDTIVRYDRDCRRIYANPAFVAMTGGEPGELLGKRPTENPGGPDAELFEARLREVLASGRNQQFEIKWTGWNGQELCNHMQMTAETDLSGEVVSVLTVGRDISERVAYEETIWRQANFDALTNLPNRRMFYDRLEQEAGALQRSGQGMVLMLIDLDRFKEVNDTLGHDMGDVLLVEASRRIGACLRKSDTVARLGGDEFTIILPGLNDRASIERIAQGLIDTLTEPFALGYHRATITASIGITRYPDDAEALDVLFKHADMAMYAAKSAGRNRFSYFTPDLLTRAPKGPGPGKEGAAEA